MKGTNLGPDFTARALWLAHHLRTVDEIGKRRAGTMADRASWEHATAAARIARELAHDAKPVVAP